MASLHELSLEHMAGAVPGYMSSTVSIRMWWPQPGLLISKIDGHLDAAAAAAIAQSIRGHIATTAAGRLTGFHDWSGLVDYDSEARILLTDVARELLPRSDGAHLLVNSQLVAFGIRAASVVLGNITSYASREPFETALSAALRRSKP